MLDKAEPLRMQRSQGLARVCFDRRAGRTALADLHQAGSAKVMVPRVHGYVPEVVLLNTSGGLTSSDRLGFSLEVAAGCRVLATTQTAERGYAAHDGPAHLDIRGTVGRGGRLDWVPQETILFQNAHLHRTTEVDLDEGAACVLAESIVLGRRAMGETLHSAALLDRRVIRRQGRPVWAEALNLNAGVLADQSGALLAGCRAFAVACLVAPGAEDAAGPVRDALGVDVAVSGWNGRCVVRIAAADGWPMRQRLAQVVRILTGRPVPRVWQSGGLT